ncbi:MAG: hypothetical protein AB1298_05470 [Bacteroidota bacterium]
MTRRFSHVIIHLYWFNIEEALPMCTFEEWQIGLGIAQVILLLVTFIGAIYIGIEQNKINQLAFEKDIKPIILREGFLAGFSSFPQADLSTLGKVSVDLGNIRLKSIRNVAKDITGKLIVAGNMYTVKFCNETTVIPPNRTELIEEITAQCLEKWSWLPEGAVLIPVADISTKTPVTEKDHLVIKYKSIIGTAYQMVEDDTYEVTIHPIS